MNTVYVAIFKVVEAIEIYIRILDNLCTGKNR